MITGSNYLLFIVILELSIAILMLFLIFRKFSYPPKSKYPNTAHQNEKVVVEKRKYAHSGISEALAVDFQQKVIQLMEKEKVYLDPGLKLKDLAHRLGLSVPNTSQLINQNLHKDFNTFINEYRIDEAIGMLEDDSGLALGNVAYEVGFNNNVTFYKAFKKYKGTSPSEYLREFILNSTG
jgi:YesN/AraC family two-component response regulator